MLCNLLRKEMLPSTAGSDGQPALDIPLRACPSCAALPLRLHAAAETEGAEQKTVRRTAATRGVRLHSGRGPAPSPVCASATQPWEARCGKQSRCGKPWPSSPPLCALSSKASQTRQADGGQPQDKCLQAWDARSGLHPPPPLAPPFCWLDRLLAAPRLPKELSPMPTQGLQRAGGGARPAGLENDLGAARPAGVQGGAAARPRWAWGEGRTHPCVPCPTHLCRSCLAPRLVDEVPTTAARLPPAAPPCPTPFPPHFPQPHRRCRLGPRLPFLLGAGGGGGSPHPLAPPHLCRPPRADHSGSQCASHRRVADPGAARRAAAPQPARRQSAAPARPDVAGQQ